MICWKLERPTVSYVCSYVECVMLCCRVNQALS